MSSLRTRGKSTVYWLLLAFLVLGLGGFGVKNFATSNSQSIGAVGDTEITAQDYARSLRAELASYAQQAGQTLTVEQAQAIGLPQAVQQRLFTAAALADEANRIGVSVGDDRVAQVIAAAEPFRGPTGQFDRTAYTETLRREGLNSEDFETTVREDEARLILQRAVAGGIRAPAPQVAKFAAWILETRDITWRELTEDDLPQPIAAPDEATLRAWHTANADRFTTPETRKITYVWLTPEMVQDQVALDDAALRALYDQKIAEYQQPERRMTGRLVFPDIAAAQTAKARLDAGQVTFEQLAQERGLTLDDTDLGELTQDQLPAEAGAAVFALEGPGVVGPFATDLGPALFAMNAILDPVNISYEQALPDLRAEAAASGARRMILDQMADYEDRLASGATLEQLAEETPMELGQIDWNADSTSDHGAISAYQAFRDRAGTVKAEDFAQLYELDDGGVFALRLDEIVAPTLKPFDTVRPEVLADWRERETHRQLLELAEERTFAAPTADPAAAPANGAPTAAPVPAPATPRQGTETALARNGWIEGVPAAVITGAFGIAEAGQTEVVDAENRVFVVTLDGINPADLATDQGAAVLDAAGRQIGDGLQNDVFEYFTRAVQKRAGVQVNDAVIAAVNAQAQ